MLPYRLHTSIITHLRVQYLDCPPQQSIKTFLLSSKNLVKNVWSRWSVPTSAGLTIKITRLWPRPCPDDLLYKLLTWTIWSNQVFGGVHKVFFYENLMLLCKCECCESDLEVKKLQTHTNSRAAQSWWLSLLWVLASPPPADCSFTERAGSELCNMLAPVLVYVGRNEGRNLSRRGILLADDVKGNDFVKKTLGLCALQRTRQSCRRYADGCMWDCLRGPCHAAKTSMTSFETQWRIRSEWAKFVGCSNIFFSLKYHVAACVSCNLSHTWDGCELSFHLGRKTTLDLCVFAPLFSFMKTEIMVFWKLAWMLKDKTDKLLMSFVGC